MIDRLANDVITSLTKTSAATTVLVHVDKRRVVFWLALAITPGRTSQVHLVTTNLEQGSKYLEAQASRAYRNTGPEALSIASSVSLGHHVAVGAKHTIFVYQEFYKEKDDRTLQEIAQMLKYLKGLGFKSGSLPWE